MKTGKTSLVFFPLTVVAVLLVSCGALGTFATDAPDNYDALVLELVAKDGSCNVGNRIDYLDTPENPLPVAPLLPLLNHESPQVRWGAAYTLRLMQNRKQCSAEMLAAAQKEQNAFALTEMVQGLGTIRSTAATPLLSELMVKHDSAEVRYAAVEAEYCIRDTNAVPALLSATFDKSPNVAIRALYVLGNIGDARAVDRLLTVASEGDRDARMSAVQALGMIGDTGAAPTLRSLLTSADASLIKQVIWSLARAHDAKTVAALLPLLEHKDPAIVEDTRQALVKIGNHEVLMHFVGQYRQDPDNSLALGVIASIFSQRNKVFGEPLKGLSSDRISALAKHLSVALKEQIETKHIKSIRYVGDILFVHVRLEGHGADFIVIRGNDEIFKSGRIIQSWIE